VVVMVEWPPVSRTTDPRTSHEADAVITVDGSRRSQVERLLEYVYQHPGFVAGEIAAETGLGMHIVGRRLADLKNQDRIYQGAARSWTGPNASGRKQITWWPSPEPRQMALL